MLYRFGYRLYDETGLINEIADIYCPAGEFPQALRRMPLYAWAARIIDEIVTPARRNAWGIDTQGGLTIDRLKALIYETIRHRVGGTGIV